MYIKSAVTRNYSEKSINSILDYISTSKQVGFDFFFCFFAPNFFNFLKILDGPPADVLRNDFGCAKRGKKRPFVVQNKHKTRQIILRSRRIWALAENFEAIAFLLSGKIRK